MKRRRARQRGAAMIEAIVIILTLLVFLGMNLFAVKAYAGKLDQSTAVRRDVMYYATHNCNERNKEDPDTYVDPSLRGATVVEGDGGYAQDLAAALPKFIRRLVGLNGESIDYGTSQGTRENVVHGDAIIWTSKHAMTSHLKTSSIVECNEKPYYRGVVGTLGHLAWDFFWDAINLWR